MDIKIQIVRRGQTQDDREFRHEKQLPHNFKAARESLQGKIVMAPGGKNRPLDPRGEIVPTRPPPSVSPKLPGKPTKGDAKRKPRTRRRSQRRNVSDNDGHGSRRNLLDYD